MRAGEKKEKRLRKRVKQLRTYKILKETYYFINT